MANFMRKVRKNQKKNKLNNVGSFDPDLDLQTFFTLFSVKIKKLQELSQKLLSLSKEEISFLANDKQKANAFVEYLYEDNMFNDFTWNAIKEYTRIMNKIGGVLLANEVEEMFGKEDLKRYYEYNLNLYLYINLYYRLFFREYIIIPLHNDFELQKQGVNLSLEDKKNIMKIIFPEFEDFYKDFIEICLNIDKDVIPDYITKMASEESNRFMVECLNKKHNSKMFFKYGQAIDKQLKLSKEEVYEEAKKILDLKF